MYGEHVGLRSGNLFSVLVALNYLCTRYSSFISQAYKYCAEIDTAGLKDPRLHETAKISAYYNLGRLYAERGDYRAAVSAYREALHRRPDYYSPQSIYNLLGETRDLYLE